MTVYLFDKWKKVRRIIPTGGVTELIHDEGAYTLTAQVAAELNVINGEYLGFRCVDGRFRMFEVSGANLDDERHVIDITATDAIVQELSEEITEDLQQLDVDLATAIKGILPGAEWVVKGQAPDRLENSRAYFAPAWTMLQTFEQLYEWRIIPYYGFDGGKITEKVIELQEDKAVFRGRILRSRKDAAKVYVTKTGRPITRLYGLGPAQGSQDLQTNMTFAEVEWSVANGDPADKPKGQAWIGDPVAEALDGVHTAVVHITDAKDEGDLLKKTWERLQEMQMPTIKADATISDMEMVPGHSHEQIRIGDLVAMRLDAGYAVEARIIGIKRNYIRRWLTKITIGDKTATLQSQVADLIASATHTFERLTIYQNRFKEDEELIQLNAAVIQLNAEHIQENANTLIEHAQWILNQAELIELRATKDDLDKVVVRLDSAEGTLTAQAEEILLKADKTYAEELFAKAVKTDELESGILEVLSYADVPYITAVGMSVQDIHLTNWLEARSADIEELSATSAGFTSASAGTFGTDSLSVGGTAATWHENTVLTGIGTITQSKRFLNLALADGGSVQLDIVTDVSISPTTTYIKYLGEA